MVQLSNIKKSCLNGEFSSSHVYMCVCIYFIRPGKFDYSLSSLLSWNSKILVMRLSIACPTIPPGAICGKTRGFDSVLNGRCAPRVRDLTLDLIKSPSNPLSGTRVRRGFDHLNCPNGGVFNHLFGQIPTLPHPLPQEGQWDQQLIGAFHQSLLSCVNYFYGHGSRGN